MLLLVLMGRLEFPKLKCFFFSRNKWTKLKLIMNMRRDLSKCHKRVVKLFMQGRRLIRRVFRKSAQKTTDWPARERLEICNSKSHDLFFSSSFLFRVFIFGEGAYWCYEWYSCCSELEWVWVEYLQSEINFIGVPSSWMPYTINW